jgi:hypothetical protein
MKTRLPFQPEKIFRLKVYSGSQICYDQKGFRQSRCEKQYRTQERDEERTGIAAGVPAPPFHGTRTRETGEG